MATKASARMSRELSLWIRWIGESAKLLRGFLEKPPGKQREEPAFSIQLTETVITTLGRVREEMQEASGNLANISDVLDVMKKDADYKGVVVSSWPKNVFADRMTYLGTILIAAGSGTYALLGIPTEIGVVLLPPAILWAFGFVLLVWGLIGVRRREAFKWSYFTKEFDVAES